ncbi:MAG TPA: ATP-binding protein [Candidatus Polarisedimenticolaceae bacterium]|nr:ATP-binding protein [Candidatus Polarisedimenticolaceae bacterium]
MVTAVRCDCERDAASDRRLRQAHLPRRYDHCRLDNFDRQNDTLTEALRRAERWVELWPAQDQGLLLHGPPGTGKTHLAVAVGRALIERKQARVLFQEQRELLRLLQGTFDSGAAQREAEILAPVLDAELLILDDLGAGRTTPWARDVMHDVIVHRYNEQKHVILTSNLQMGEEPDAAAAPRALDAPLSLRDRLGDALMSRLYEMCLVVELSGRDYRTGARRFKDRY